MAALEAGKASSALYTRIGKLPARFAKRGKRGNVLTPWLALLLAGLLEIGWAVGLKYSDGLTLLAERGHDDPIVFSFALLGMSLKSVPFGTAYALWTGSARPGPRSSDGGTGVGRHIPRGLSELDRRRHGRSQARVPVMTVVPALRGTNCRLSVNNAHNRGASLLIFHSIARRWAKPTSSQPSMRKSSPRQRC
jgi:hypothetical protein